MASQGPLSAGSSAAVDYHGSTDWQNINQVFSSDNSKASVVMSAQDNAGSNYFSDYLYGTNHGFTIPVGATIDGVVAEVQCSDNFSPHAIEYSRRLTKDGTTFVGAEKTAGQTLSTTSTYYSCGGAADLWSTTLTYTEVNASTFGQMVQFTGGASSGARVFVDHMRMTVYYTVASGQPTSRRFSQIQRNLKTFEFGREGVSIG